MEVNISQDIRRFKTKDIGNFNFKEIAWIVAGLAVGFLVQKLTNSLEIAILPAGVIIVLGFFKPYGMSAVKFIKLTAKDKLSRQCYIYETDFEYDYDEFKELYGDDVVIPTVQDVIQTKETVKINKEDDKRLIK